MSLFDDVRIKVVGDLAVEETYAAHLTVQFRHVPEDRTGTFPQAPGNNPADDWPEENLVVWKSIVPACPKDGDCMSFARGRLCHGCWFAEYVSCVGEDAAFVRHLEDWEGRGQWASLVTLEGYMGSDACGDGEYDDRFECEVVGVERVHTIRDLDQGGSDRIDELEASSQFAAHAHAEAIHLLAVALSDCVQVAQ